MISILLSENTENLQFLAGLDTKSVLLGICIAFIILAVLYAAVKICKYIFYKPQTIPQTAVTAEQTYVREDEDENETVAAIAAAIAMYTGSSPSSFRVVSFKRIR